MDLGSIRDRLAARYVRYTQRYMAYARQRGFQSLNDGPYHRSGFLECWTEPGLHNFWRVWNPGIAYFVFRLYVALGGSKRWVLATLLSFVINGWVHAGVFFLFTRQWSWVIPVLFLLFGVLTVISWMLGPVLCQERWPALMNLALHAGLVILSFDLSFAINAELMRAL